MVVFSTPTVKVRERLSYHLRHIRQREPITLSLLICFLRLSLHSYNSPHFSLWLISFSSNSHLSTSAVSTSLLLSCLLLPFISPQDKKVKGGGGPFTFLSFDRLSFPGLLWVLTSLFVSSKTPSLQRSSLVVSSHFLSFPFFLPVGLSQLAGCMGLRGPGAAEHG